MAVIITYIGGDNNCPDPQQLQCCLIAIRTESFVSWNVSGRYRNATLQTRRRLKVTGCFISFKPLLLFTEEPNDSAVIYDEVKIADQAMGTNPVIPGSLHKKNTWNIITINYYNKRIVIYFVLENTNKAPLYPLLNLVAAAGLGVICVTLVSVVIALSIHCKSTCFQGLSRQSDSKKNNGFFPDRSQHSHFRAAQRKQQLNGTESAAADTKGRPGETDGRAEQREGPTQLDHGSHHGIWELPSECPLPTERWKHGTAYFGLLGFPVGLLNH